MYTSLFTLISLATTALAANFTVQVGQGGLVFTPDEVTAAVGDTVNFVFSGTTHTVTQSTFASPCTNSGFDSGFAAGAGQIFSVAVNDTKPIWVYCKPHCQKGMVMAINANDSSANSFTAFKSAATGNTASSSNSSSSAASSPSSTSSGASSTSSQASTSSKASSGISVVEKAGLSAILFMAVSAGLLVL